MNWRAFVFALLTAVVGVALLVIYHRRYEQEVSGGPRIRVLSASRVVPRGVIVTDEMLTVHEVPQAYYEDRMLRDAERAKVIGLRIGNTVRAQQTLTWSDVVTTSDERRDLSSLIQPGSRAVSIRASRDDANISLIRPGDYVDVIATSVGASHESRSASVLLQKILVLASTSSGSDATREPGGETSLTLSVTIPEAQQLALAMERGRLMVALRNPDDPKIAERLPDLVSTTVGEAHDRAPLKVNRGPIALSGTVE